MNPLVSVVIPFYNRVDWLGEAIESVLNQTYDNFEIIVVNDGSTEKMDDFLYKYGDKIIYRYKENGGAATARNLALEIATGEFIAFLDSDDVWLPEKTEKQIAFMNESNVMWSHTAYYNWYPEKDKLILNYNSRDYDNVYLQSFVSLRTPTPAIIVKKECFDKHPEFRFPEDMRKAQDSALWSKIAYLYPLGLVNKPFIKVRQRGTNADTSSLIRFNVKTTIYKKIKEGFYKEVTTQILMILKLYVAGNYILNYLSKKFKFNKKTLEFTGKLLWILPFFMERIYLRKLIKGKDVKYKVE